jgi:thiamine-monophosphate kinase
MDITDGLAYSVGELSRQSGIAFQLHWCSVPYGEEVQRVADKAGVSLKELVLNFGGDYELLFTVSPEAVDELAAALEGRLHVIGRAIKGQNVLIDGEKVVPLDTRGYEHFRS